MGKRRQLSEADWAKVFEARCLSKRGLPLSEDQQTRIDAAYKSDPKRYAAMERDVFNATVPFGSTAKR